MTLDKLMGKMRPIPWGKAMGLLLVVWILFLVIALGLMRHEPDQQSNQRRITQALRDLQSWHNQREEISKLITEYNAGSSVMKEDERAAFKRMIQLKAEIPGINGIYTEASKDSPPLEYERLRRRLHMGVEEMWFFMSSQIKSLQKQSKDLTPQIATKISRILDEGVEHSRSLLRDVNKLSDVDGYAGWRLKEAVELSDLVQRRLYFLQNPSKCDQARKLICNLNKGCGYGCQLHHAVYCLLVAYGTERTLILKSKGWRYNKAGWEQVFKPISDTCTTYSSPVVNWPGQSHSQTVMLGVVDLVSPRPPYLPLAVPKDLADRISRLHGDPSVWWIGQFLKYLLRPQPTTTDMLKDAALKFNFQHPIVGVHIRRTDKVGTEAAFHSIDEYMMHVEEYFQRLSLTKDIPHRRIYLATDDYKVFEQVKAKYPKYHVLGDPEIAKTAAVSSRYSDTSLQGIIMDIYFLAQSDYLVCTFSSQVCRVAYEIMQSLHPDSSNKFRSLDDIYYYGGQGLHRKIAVLPHKPTAPGQIELEVGDIVGVAGNHWDGYSKGRNLRTNHVGLYPSFKVDDVIEAVDFPTFSDVPIDSPLGSSTD